MIKRQLEMMLTTLVLRSYGDCARVFNKLCFNLPANKAIINRLGVNERINE